MEVFAITIFMSLALAMLFAVLCYAERSQRLRRPCEQDALMPLDDNAPVTLPLNNQEHSHEFSLALKP